MANNTIQIKRSTSNGTVSGLANGELAFTQASNTLWIGLPDGSGTAAIGGVRNPGTLTANQALVANATGYIDQVKTANLIVSSVYANGSYGTSGQVLVSNGSTVFWGTGTSGSNTQVQFNDAGVANASAGFTFNKVSNNLFVGNSVLATTANAASFTVGTSWTVNSTGEYHSGLINASSFNVGTNFIANSTQVTIGSGVGLSANGSLGTAGQALQSNGSSLYWANVTSVAGSNTQIQFNDSTFSNASASFTFNKTTNTLTVGNSSVNTQVTPGNVYLNGSTLVVGNTAANITINSSTITVGNATVNATVNSTIYTGTANNVSFVGSVSAANVVSNAQLSSNLANYQTTAGLSANVATLTANNTSFVGSIPASNVVSNAQLSSNLANYQTTAGLSANVATLTANNSNYLGGTAAAGYQTTSGLSANVATLTANNVSFVGSVSAANVVSNAQLSSNLANYQTTAGLSSNVAGLTANNANYLGGTAAAGYQTTAGLSANVATLTSNNTSFVGSVSAANVVSNAQLSSNLANYQTTAGLSANVATLTANNTSFVGTVSAANVVSNAQLSSNLANYQTTAGLSANVATLTANNTSFVGSVSAANVVSNAQLSSNLANYALLSGATFTGNVVANNLSTSYDLNISRNAVINGNLTVYGTSISVSAANFTTTDNMLYLNEPDTQSVTGASGNGSVITYTANNNFSNGGVVSVTGITPSGFNTSGYVTVTYANSTVFQVSNTFTGTYTSGGSAAFRMGINPDIGIVGGYNDGTYHHTGIMRDYNDGVWKVFDNYQPEPDQAVNIDTTNSTFHIANFQANTLYLGNTSTNWIVANTSGVFAGSTLIGNSTGAYGKTESNLNVNSALSSNNSSYLGGTAASGYQTTAGLSANVATLTANNSNYLGGTAASGYQTTAGLSANVATLTANNTSFVGSVSAANVVSNSQLSSNLANYQTTAGLSSNVAGLTANNTSFVGTVAAANVVSNSQLSSNLANYQTTAGLSSNVAGLTANNANYLGGTAAAGYQTTAGLSSNVAGLTANNTSFVGSIPAANVVSNAQLSSNLTNYQTTAGLSANVATLTANNSSYLGGTAASGYQTTAGLSANVATLTANNTSFVGTVSAANVVSNAQLSSNLANYQTTSGLSANVATLTANNSNYLGGTAASGYQTTAGLSANVATLTANNSNYLGGTAASYYVQYNDSRTLSGNLVFSGANVNFTGSKVTVSSQASVNNLTITGSLTANGTTGGTNQVLSSNSTGGIYWSVPASAAGATYVTQSFIADGVSNTFTVTGGYTPNMLSVFLDGVRMTGSEANVSSGSTVNFSFIPNNTLNIDVVGFLANTILTAPNTAAQYTWTNTHTFNANVTISAGLIANGSIGSAGQALQSNGSSVYWANVTSVAGSNTQVQFNDSGFSNASAGFTFIKTSNTLNVSNNVNSASYTVGSSFVANSSAITGSGYAKVANGLYSIGAFNGTFTDGIVMDYVTGNGRISVGTANQITFYTGNVAVSSMAVVNTTGLYTPYLVNAASYNVGTNFIANSSQITFTGANIVATSSQLNVRDIIASGNLIVGGTVVSVNVQTLIVNDNIIELADNNTTTDVVDTGWFSPAGNSTNIWYSGLARIAGKSSNVNPYFWLFGSNTNPNTATTIDTSSNSVTGTLQAFLAPYGTSGAFIANSSVINITANSSVSAAIVANSLSLTTALAAVYGGTGQSSYSVGDLLFANTSTTLNKLSVGSNGQVLQIVNNLPAYGSLDGGTF
jgi:hypothetical protein